MRSMWISRRSFLAGGASLAVLTACGSGGNERAPTRLGVRFPDGLRAPTVAVADAGPQRFPFVAIGDGFPMTSNAPESIEIELSHNGQVIGTEIIGVRGVGQFTPYYPLVFTPPAAGRYIARTTFSDIDIEFTVEERSNVALFQVGDQLPPFDTPTFESGRGVNPVCTRAPDPCPFHDITLTEAVENNRPTALLIASPAFCLTDVCGPSIEFFIAAAQGRDDMDFVHAEVFADPENTGSGQLPPLAPLLIDWALDFEPALFVADASGTIVSTRHFAIDRDEMADAISLG